MTKLFLVISLMLAMVTPAMGKTIHVAVASNFSQPLQLLARSFELKSGHKVHISTASTGKLYAQIKHGAPYHLFLAADQKRPKKLEEEGFTIPGSRFTYAVGQLVLWAPREQFQGTAKKLIGQTEIRRFSIANPKTAPYGVAARQTLQALGLWEQLQGRLVKGENIAQTLQFVASGASEMGFVALSQLSEKAMSRGYHWIVPQRLHSPIRQDAVLLKQEPANLAAQAFHAFLQSDRARALIHKLGYKLEDH